MVRAAPPRFLLSSFTSDFRLPDFLPALAGYGFAHLKGVSLDAPDRLARWEDHFGGAMPELSASCCVCGSTADGPEFSAISHDIILGTKRGRQGLKAFLADEMDEALGNLDTAFEFLSRHLAAGHHVLLHLHTILAGLCCDPSTVTLIC